MFTCVFDNAKASRVEAYEAQDYPIEPPALISTLEHYLDRQGLKRQGLKRQGLKRQGLKRQGLKRQGLKRQGLKRQGLKRQDLTPYRQHRSGS